MLFMISNFICDIKFYLWYEILFAIWTLIYDIKFYLWYQKIFNFKYFLNEGNFFIIYFLHYQLFFYGMKHFFKELLRIFIASVFRVLAIRKLTAHVLKHVARPLQKHGGLHGWSYSLLITTACWIRGCEAIWWFYQWS